MLEFEKTLGELTSHLQESHRGYSNGWAHFREAEKSFASLEEIRKGMLLSILKERGLGLCCDSHYDSIAEEYGREKIENPTAEQLGIFPLDLLKLRFVQGHQFGHDRETGSWDTPFREILLLCPKHFGQRYINVHEGESWPNLALIYDEVLQKDGKLLLKGNGKDVTEIMEKTGWGHKQMELEGKKNPDLLVYRHFGIPDLPPNPDLSMVR